MDLVGLYSKRVVERPQVEDLEYLLPGVWTQFNGRIMAWTYRAPDAGGFSLVGAGVLVQDDAGRWWARITMAPPLAMELAGVRFAYQTCILPHLLSEAPGEVWFKTPRLNPGGCDDCAAQHPADGGECEGTCHRLPAADWEYLGHHDGEDHYRSWKGRAILRGGKGQGPITLEATLLLAALVRKHGGKYGKVRLRPDEVARVQETPAVLVSRDVDDGVITLETRGLVVKQVPP